MAPTAMWLTQAALLLAAVRAIQNKAFHGPFVGNEALLGPPEFVGTASAPSEALMESSSDDVADGGENIRVYEESEEDEHKWGRDDESRGQGKGNGWAQGKGNGWGHGKGSGMAVGKGRGTDNAPIRGGGTLNRPSWAHEEKKMGKQGKKKDKEEKETKTGKQGKSVKSSGSGSVGGTKPLAPTPSSVQATAQPGAGPAPASGNANAPTPSPTTATAQPDVQAPVPDSGSVDAVADAQPDVQAPAPDSGSVDVTADAQPDVQAPAPDSGSVTVAADAQPDVQAPAPDFGSVDITADAQPDVQAPAPDSGSVNVAATAHPDVQAPAPDTGNADSPTPPPVTVTVQPDVQAPAPDTGNVDAPTPSPVIVTATDAKAPRVPKQGTMTISFRNGTNETQCDSSEIHRLEFAYIPDFAAVCGFCTAATSVAGGASTGIAIDICRTSVGALRLEIYKDDTCGDMLTYGDFDSLQGCIYVKNRAGYITVTGTGDFDVGDLQFCECAQENPVTLEDTKRLAE